MTNILNFIGTVLLVLSAFFHIGWLFYILGILFGMIYLTNAIILNYSIRKEEFLKILDKTIETYKNL